MTQSFPQTARPESAGREETPHLVSLSLKLGDHAGRTRRGRAIFLPKHGGPADIPGPSEGDEFRILILAEPLDGPLVPPEGTVVSAPARPLSGFRAAKRRPSTSTGHAGLPITQADLEALRKGRLFASVPLPVTAEEVFAGGRARLALLAKALFVSQALSGYLEAIAIALAAPGPAQPAAIERLKELRLLLEACGGAGFVREAAEAETAITNLRELTASAEPPEVLAGAERLYPSKQALMEDIYLLRSLQQNPDEASELLGMRRFVSQAQVPADWGELAADRALLAQELTYAALATESQRFPLARAALERFRRRYAEAYAQHHSRYWAEMARLHAMLLEERAHAEALRRINTLADLGPPMGVGILATAEELLAQPSGCPQGGSVEDIAAAEGGCLVCRLTLDQSPPAQPVQQTIARIERACEKQVTRLTSHIVHLVIRGRGDARLQQLLTVLQASQLSNLLDIMDDEVLAYLRTALAPEGEAPAAETPSPPGPEAADELAGSILREVLSRHSQAELHVLLRKVAERMAAPYTDRVAGRPLAARAREIAAIILEQGCRVDAPRAEGGAHYIDEYSCPFPLTAARNPAVCAFHVEWVSILGGADVRLTRSLLRNQPACTFRIGGRPRAPAPRQPRKARHR